MVASNNSYRKDVHENRWVVQSNTQETVGPEESITRSLEVDIKVNLPVVDSSQYQLKILNHN